MHDPLGWQGLEMSNANDEVFKAECQKQFELNTSIAGIFKGDNGKRVLAWLRMATIESAAWSPSIARAHGVEAANAHAYAREGQNALVRDLERRIDLAKKCKTVEDLSKLAHGGLND